MARQGRQAGWLNATFLRLAPGGLVLFALLPIIGQAQEKQPALVPPATLARTNVINRQTKSDEKPAAPPTPGVDVITLGTTKARVDLYLGAPRSGGTINCLNRASFTYNDETRIVFVCDRAVSVIPGGLAEGDEGHGYMVEAKGRQVFIDPVVLFGVKLDGPMGETKREVEEAFLYAPPAPLELPGPPISPECGALKRVRLF